MSRLRAAGLIVAALASLPAAAADPDVTTEGVPDPVAGVPVPPPGFTFCYPQLGYCIVRVEDYVVMRSCVLRAPEMIYGLRAELEKMRALKGCAKSEVTEPPKKLPKIPRESDS